MKFSKKESAVARYFKSKCDLDGFVKVYSHMNCIEVEDYEDTPLYDTTKATEDELMPKFKITKSDNEELPEGGILTWETVDKYIDNLLKEGSKDCIECAYSCIIKLNKRRK